MRLLLCKGVMQVQLLQQQQHGSACTRHPQQAAQLPKVPLINDTPMQMQALKTKDLQQVLQPVTSAYTQPLLLSHLPNTEASPNEYPQAISERLHL